MPDLDIAAIIRTLNAHRVDYVVIGGVAAMVRNLPVPATVDIDVTPARNEQNLVRLAAAFDDREAGLLAADARALVITVAVWERLKQAAGRPKDLEHLDRFYESR